MGFLTGLFAPKTPIARVRKAVTRSFWADAVAYGADIDRALLSPEEAAELDQLLCRSGDALAELNLAEGEACLVNADFKRAQEHFELVLRYGRRPELLGRVKELLAATPELSVAVNESCTAGCCSPPVEMDTPRKDAFDSGTSFELLLASYPPELHSRYLAAGEAMIDALLLAHEGEVEALSAFAVVPENERDDLYWYELGIFQAHQGSTLEARQHLEHSLHLNPEGQLPRESLVDLLLTIDALAAAEAWLDASDRYFLQAGFKTSRLAVIAFRNGHKNEALSLALKAIEDGCRDDNIIVLAARLLEDDSCNSEAERVLLLLSTGGCSGKANQPLAEFRLRHGRELEKTLDAFRALARHDPANPYWALRLGQTYLKLGREREARPLLEAFLVAGADSNLLQQAQQALSQISSEVAGFAHGN